MFFKRLEPRYFLEHQLLQDQFEEVYEVQFITKGQVAVGYRLYNEEYFAKTLKDYANIGAYGCLKNKVSEFFFRSLERVETFGMRK